MFYIWNIITYKRTNLKYKHIIYKEFKLNTFFTSDQHFEHRAIIDHCQRPFVSTKHMKNIIKKCWNRVVKEEDKVYVVGDFSLQSPKLRQIFKQILDNLNGRKILVVGNHEVDKIFFYAGDHGIGFEQVVYPYLEVEEFVLCHDPTLSIVLPDRPFIVGHVHQMWHTLRNCYNVGVDVNDFTPVSIETIREHFRNNTDIKVEAKIET